MVGLGIKVVIREIVSLSTWQKLVDNVVIQLARFGFIMI
jgi:hypothetical protein